MITRCRAKPNVTSPGYATSRPRSKPTKIGNVSVLTDRENNFRLITYNHISTKPENLAKIDPVDFEAGLTGMVKNK